MSPGRSIELYAHAWAQREADAISAALTECWDPHGRYVDPITDRDRCDGGNDPRLRLPAPGAALTPTAEPELHHHVGRFGWVMTAPAPIVASGVDYGRTLHGFDVVEFAADHRIAAIIGFFLDDTVPAHASGVVS